MRFVLKYAWYLIPSLRVIINLGFLSFSNFRPTVTLPPRTTGPLVPCQIPGCPCYKFRVINPLWPSPEKQTDSIIIISSDSEDSGTSSLPSIPTPTKPKCLESSSSVEIIEEISKAVEVTQIDSSIEQSFFVILLLFYC